MVSDGPKFMFVKFEMTTLFTNNRHCDVCVCVLFLKGPFFVFPAPYMGMINVGVKLGSLGML